MNAAPLNLPRVVLRADGNPRIGLGHVMRLMALAEILRPAFAITFAIQEPSRALTAQLVDSGAVVIEIPPMPYEAEPVWLHQHALQAADTVVLDGYGFEFNYQQAIRNSVARLVCLDDLHAFPFAADAVLNPAGGVRASDYDLRQPHARLFSGPAYAPLRPAFYQAPEAGSAPTDTVLVCLGGADPTHQTQQIAATLLGLDAAAVRRVHVVVGSAYVGWEILERWAVGHAPRLQVHRNLSATELAALMRQCGAAVCSPSTVSYEYCSAQGGLLLVHPTATNQQDLDHFLRHAGLALPYQAAGNVLSSPEASRVAAQLQQAQRRLFDGQAPQRLRQLFQKLRLPPIPFKLRPVATADSPLLLDWANDPVVRQHSFSSAAVTLAEHTAWFIAKLNDPNALLLIAEEAATGTPLGLIRYTVEGAQATLSYQLAASHRGRGWAALLLTAGTEVVAHVFAHLRYIVGHVQLTNEASIRAFRKAGFEQEPTRPHDTPDSVTFAWVL